MTREIQLPFERLFDTAPDAMVISDYQGHIVLVNTMAERMLGYSRVELISQPLEILVPEQHRDGHAHQRQKYYRHPRTRPMGEGRELYAVRKDGSMFSAEISLSPMEVDGRLLITSAIRDITERKQIQKTLEQQTQDLMRSNAELEQFAYVASHDLQEPLRMVSSYAQLLARRYRSQLDSDADEFIEFMVDGATRMQALINDLLAYSRVGTKNRTFATTNSNWIIQQVLESLRFVVEETQACLTVDPLPFLIADEAQLAQLFQNLISNALKFRRETIPRIHISAQEKKNETIFSIADNGIGIEPQYAERIFLLFQRLHSKREYPGTGIGLAICKKIVECHGGRIWVESRQGEGATFFFALPLEPNEAPLP